MTIAATGTGVKNLAIGVAVLAGVAAVVYLSFKGRAALSAVADKASEAGGFLFSAGDAPETLGTKIYDFFNAPSDRNASGAPYYWDVTQAEKTRIALISQREKTGFE